MAQKQSYLTVTDQFCGAGGSSQGARKFLDKIGGEVKLALNHWKLAIETHQTNFPDTIHDCTDIQACDPRRYPSTDILITSPECTNHSVGNGKKKEKAQMDLFNKGIVDAAAERSRATMWDVPRFAEYHNYNIIITENVVDARKWVMYDAWIMAMRSLGYEHKVCFLNSMHFWPTPQSRDRMYVVFWKKGNKAPDLDYRPLANCQGCGKDVHAVQSWKPNQKSWKYKTGYVYCCPSCSKIVEPYYYAAFNCIDWSIPGIKIGERKKKLALNTEIRIRKGMEMFENRPIIVSNQYGVKGNRSSPLDDPLKTITTQHNTGFMHPFIINNQHSTGVESRIRGTMEAMNTFSTQANFGLLSHAGILDLSSNGKLKPIDHPLGAVLAGGNHHGLFTTPVMVENKGQSTARPATEALSALTTISSHGILTAEAFNSFISYYNGGSDVSSHITSPAGAFTTRERHGLVHNVTPRYEDCYYRTLRAHEIKIGMAFEKSYILLGDSKAQVRQCGNAVNPPVMEWLIEQTANTLM